MSVTLHTMHGLTVHRFACDRTLTDAAGRVEGCGRVDASIIEADLMTPHDTPQGAAVRRAIMDTIHATGAEGPNTPTLAFADPPYGQAIDYGPHAPKDTRAAAENLVCHTCEIMGSCTAGDVTAWLLLPESLANMAPWPPPMMDTRPRVIWHERFAQYHERDYVTDHRHLLRASRGTPPWHPDATRVESVRQQMGDKRAGGARPNPGRVPGTVWTVRRLQGTAKDRYGDHPCQLPPEPLARIVLGHTDPGDTVLELFTGVGSLARVCVQHGRHYVGVEISGEHCRATMARLAGEFGEDVSDEPDGVQA